MAGTSANEYMQPIAVPTSIVGQDPVASESLANEKVAPSSPVAEESEEKDDFAIQKMTPQKAPRSSEDTMGAVTATTMSALKQSIAAMKEGRFSDVPVTPSSKRSSKVDFSADFGYTGNVPAMPVVDVVEPSRLSAGRPCRKVQTGSTSILAEPRGSPWHSAVVDRLSLAQSANSNGVWDRWAARAEGIAGDHVKTNFVRLASQYQEALACDTTEEVSVSLALVGSAAADHEATLCQVEALFKELPSTFVARVCPDDFRSLAFATRRIAEHLLRGNVALSTEAAEASDEEGEGLDEVDESTLPQRVGIVDFLDWYHARRLRAGVVLVVERADAVRKDLLRDVLNSWGAACCDSNLGKPIPLFVVLGLQQPVSSRFDLLEGQPSLVSLRVADALKLFDAREVAVEFLTYLATDGACPSALPPQLLTWLQERFDYKSRSISDLLRVLGMICARTSSDSPLSGLAAPLLGGKVFQNSDMLKLYAKRAQAAVAKHSDAVRAVWTEWESLSSSALAREVTNAASQAALWRSRLCRSLHAWDALLVAVDPISRGEAPLRRYTRLLDLLWPQDFGTSPEAEAAEAEQRRKVDSLIVTCVGRLEAIDEQPGGDLKKLWRDLMDSSDMLPEHLREKLVEMSDKQGSLGTALHDWFYELRKDSWQPLAGAVRSLFMAAFDVGGPASDVERRFQGYTTSSAASSYAESLLKQLAGVGGRPENDFAHLCRLFECHGGKSIDVGQLWHEFRLVMLPSERSPTAAEFGSLKQRFGYALLGLHKLGLFVPVSGARGQQDNQTWRLRKRTFGRVWACPKAPKFDFVTENLISATELAGEMEAQHCGDSFPSGHPEATEPRAPLFDRAMLKRRRPDEFVGRNGQEPAGKTRAKEGRARVFMG